MLEVKGLSVNVNGKKTVDDVSLSVKGGEIHVIMGPNGAGKSTLALALMGYPEFKTSGAIALDGKDITKSKPDERARLACFSRSSTPRRSKA